MIADSFTLPGNHCPRLDNNQGIPPSTPTAREPRPKNTVSSDDLRALGRSLIHGKLRSKCHNLELQGKPRADHSSQELQQRVDSGFHRGESFTNATMSKDIRLGLYLKKAKNIRQYEFPGRTAPLDHLDVDSHARSSCDPFVPGNQSCFQLTCQCYIASVVRC